MDFEEVYELMSMPVKLLFDAIARSCNDDIRCQMGVLEMVVEQIDQHIVSLQPTD